MKNLIKQHNSKILSEAKTHQEKSCNCRNKSNCPLNGNCQVKTIVYKATVTTQDNYRIYYGTSEGEFKTRYNNIPSHLGTGNTSTKLSCRSIYGS